ncbi:MAG: TolC family protein [Bacteroidales bacterium]
MSKRLKTNLLYLSVILIVPFYAYSQEVKKFTLREAQVYALEHNYDVINAITDIEIARKKVKENLAIGLPQIDATAGYTNFIELPTQLIPAEFFGEEPGTFQEIQFGTQHNATWNASLNQLIFSGQYIVGLMASQAYVGLVETSLEKTQIEINNLIATSYYPVIILQENKKVFDSTLVSLNEMLYETDEYFKAGFLEDTDVDQLQLLISNMQTTITNLDNQLQIARNMLKYMMGIPADVEIEVTDKMEDLLASVDREFLLDSPFDYGQHIDFILLKKQEQMAILQLKLNRSEYYPTINGFYTFQQDAMRNEFDFFNSSNSWYTNQMFGVNLSLPIFSSGYRKAKVQQARLELNKLKVQENQLQQGLSLKVRTVKSEFNNAYLVYQNKKNSVKNAEKIYQKTEVKYASGLSTSLELSQTYNQYLNTQIEYLTSILELLNKKAELEKELTKANYNYSN